jgi:hypothetical protein
MKRWAVGLVVMVVAAGVAVAAGQAAAAPASIECGTKVLYGTTLPLRVVGGGLSCVEAQMIVRGSCREGKTWSCFSFRPPGPVLVWFKSRERFAKRWTTTIEAGRVPCAQATVSAAAWAETGRSSGSGFPSRRQVLADDLVRCGQLRGKTYKVVRALLGRPSEQSRQGGTRSADWQIGLERDSFFQLDSEYLSLRFGRDDVLRSATMTQG